MGNLTSVSSLNEKQRQYQLDDLQTAWLLSMTEFDNVTKNIDASVLLEFSNRWQIVYEKDLSKYDHLIDAMKQHFSDKEINENFINKLWDMAHSQLKNPKKALFALKKNPDLANLPRIKTHDIFFDYVVHGEQIKTISPGQLFDAWKNGHYTDLLDKNFIVSRIVIPDTQMEWCVSEVPKFLLWWNKNIGNLTGRYVVSFDYYEDSHEESYEFYFVKRSFNIKKDDNLDFVGHLTAHVMFGMAESFNYTLTINGIPAEFYSLLRLLRTPVLIYILSRIITHFFTMCETIYM